jgi:dihydroorotase
MVDTIEKNWQAFGKAARAAGYSALQIMPDLDPPVTDKLSLAHYEQLAQSMPIATYLTAVGTSDNAEQIKQMRNITAVKVWLGTGPEDLVITKEEELRKILLSTDKPVMIHVEDEISLLRNFDVSTHELTLEQHARIFNRQSAVRAAVKAITAAKETGRRIYLSHISTAEEVELVRKAKEQGIRVYAEVAPHHLFLTEEDMKRLGMLGKVNPPLRTADDQVALWEGINDGTIDTIGSDTYMWWQGEKETSYEDAPSGFPNLFLTLPLLLSAVKEKKTTLETVIALTSTNPAKIFAIPKPTRYLYVDADTPRPIKTPLTDWHPYQQDHLVGWPLRRRIENVSK